MKKNDNTVEISDPMTPDSMKNQVNEWTRSKGMDVECSFHEEPPAELDYRNLRPPELCPKYSSGVMVAIKMDLPHDENAEAGDNQETTRLLVWIPSSEHHVGSERRGFTYQRCDRDPAVKEVNNQGDCYIPDALDRNIIVFKRDHIYWPPVREWLDSINAPDTIINANPLWATPIEVQFQYDHESTVTVAISGMGWVVVCRSNSDRHETMEGFQNGSELLAWVKERAIGGGFGKRVREAALPPVLDPRLNPPPAPLTDSDQLELLEYIFSGAWGSPCFKDNPKYPIEGAPGIPRISYDDVMANNLTIRVACAPPTKNIWNDRDKSATTLASYNSLVDLVGDGWRLIWPFPTGRGPQ